MTTEQTAKPKRGLGRGLNALFEDDEAEYPQVDPESPGATGPVPGGRQTLGVDQLQPGLFQPRTLFDDESLDELASSIKQHGLLQPILVRPLKGDTGRFEIIAGERRWRASQKAGLHMVAVIIQEFSDEEALEIGLIENLQREDLNPVDEAMGYKKLIDTYGHTQEDIADSIGKSRSYVANMVRLLNLPDKVLGKLEVGDISMGHARALVSAADPEELLRKILAGGLSVRETEKLAARESGKDKKSKSGSAAPAGKTPDVIALENMLSGDLGMRVTVESKDTQGKVTIEFKNLDQLDELIKKLTAVYA